MERERRSREYWEQELSRRSPCQSEGALESPLPFDVRCDRHNSEATVQYA